MRVLREWTDLSPHLTEAKTVAFHAMIARGSPDACWEWTGARGRHGYGTFYLAPIRGPVASHRIAYGLANGAIPAGLLVLHRCDNPPCCNPAHLWVGTNNDNMLDMVAKGRWRGKNTMSHCTKGHEFTPENTVNSARGRRCRACTAATRLRRKIRRQPEYLSIRFLAGYRFYMSQAS